MYNNTVANFGKPDAADDDSGKPASAPVAFPAFQLLADVQGPTTRYESRSSVPSPRLFAQLMAGLRVCRCCWLGCSAPRFKPTPWSQRTAASRHCTAHPMRSECSPTAVSAAAPHSSS